MQQNSPRLRSLIYQQQSSSHIQSNLDDSRFDLKHSVNKASVNKEIFKQQTNIKNSIYPFYNQSNVKFPFSNLSQQSFPYSREINDSYRFERQGTCFDNQDPIEVPSGNNNQDQIEVPSDNKAIFQQGPNVKKQMSILKQQANTFKITKSKQKTNNKVIKQIRQSTESCQPSRNKNKNIIRDLCTKCALYIETNPRAQILIQERIQTYPELKKIIKKQIQNLRAVKNFQSFREYYGRKEPIVQFLKILTKKFYDQDAFVYIWNSSIAYKQQTTNQIGYFKYYVDNLEGFNQYRKWKKKQK